VSHLRLTAFFLILGSALAQDTWNAWLQEGVNAFKGGRYRDAVAAFQKSVDLNPSAVTPRLYLATAWMNQYIPGATSPENLQAASNAEREFLATLDLEPRNVAALESLASFKYLESQGAQVLEDKLKLLDDARGWYLKLIEADPGRKEAHYSLGVIAWASWYPEWNAARVKLGMRPDQPGPFEDAAVRADLRSRHGAMLRDGFHHLIEALAIDPQYDDAMAYVNLLLREYADLSDSKAEYRTMTADADAWVQRALDTRREKAEQNTSPAAVGTTGSETAGSRVTAPPPEPATEQASPPKRITVGGMVMESKLVSRTPPKYPTDAKEARIEGDVLLTAIIAKDGSVMQLDVKSGHPLLAAAALEAVRQWKYQPTLLNGQPVEVVTSIHFNFTLDKPAGVIVGGSPHRAA
jgi:TonB family protein